MVTVAGPGHSTSCAIDLFDHASDYANTNALVKTLSPTKRLKVLVALWSLVEADDPGVGGLGDLNLVMQDCHQLAVAGPDRALARGEAPAFGPTQAMRIQRLPLLPSFQFRQRPQATLKGTLTTSPTRITPWLH